MQKLNKSQIEMMRQFARPSGYKIYQVESFLLSATERRVINELVKLGLLVRSTADLGDGRNKTYYMDRAMVRKSAPRDLVAQLQAAIPDILE